MSQSINKSKVEIFPTHFFFNLTDNVKNAAQLLCNLHNYI